MLYKESLPNKSKAILYLLQLPVVVYILKYSHYHIHNSIITMSIFWAFLILFGLIIGWNSLSPYLNKINNSKKETFFVGIELYLYEVTYTAIILIIFHYLSLDDPQGLKNLHYSLNFFLINHFLQNILVAFSEEFFKILIFLAFVSLFGYKNKLTIIISVLLSCFIFGGIHGIGYPITCVIPVAVSSIPSFIFLIKYKSIYPLIISHFIFDTVSFLAHAEPLGYEFAIFFCMIIILTFMISKCFIPMLKDIFGR